MRSPLVIFLVYPSTYEQRLFDIGGLIDAFGADTQRPASMSASIAASAIANAPLAFDSPASSEARLIIRLSAPPPSAPSPAPQKSLASSGGAATSRKHPPDDAGTASPPAAKRLRTIPPEAKEGDTGEEGKEEKKEKKEAGIGGVEPAPLWDLRINRQLLAAHSPIFAKMFEGEKKQAIIHVPHAHYLRAASNVFSQVPTRGVGNAVAAMIRWIQNGEAKLSNEEMFFLLVVKRGAQISKLVIVVPGCAALSSFRTLCRRQHGSAFYPFGSRGGSVFKPLGQECQGHR